MTYTQVGNKVNSHSIKKKKNKNQIAKTSCKVLKYGGSYNYTLELLIIKIKSSNLYNC